MRVVSSILALFVSGVVSTAALAAEVSGQIAFEQRMFTQSALDNRQSDAVSSLSFLPEFYTDWDDGRQSFTFTPFIRWDQRDSERSHADIREALWVYAADDYEISAGIGKVFWGVTEANHLVDIINQTDLIEGPDGEEKLGQPMIKFSMERDWGILDAYVLPYFRERSFPGNDGRLRAQPRVATEMAQYESGAGEKYVDVALRWSQTFGDWDVAVAHFHGTGRAPSVALGTDGNGNSVYIPTYMIIDQTSLEAQLVDGDTLWKLEAIHRGGQGESYFATAAGIEHTLVGINEGVSDLGLLLELNYDERGSSASSPLNRDVFAGLRWTANDEQGTELLSGVVRDISTEATAFSLEGSRRLGQDWKLSVQARAWIDIPPGDPVYAMRNDDFVEFKLARYF